MTTIALRVTPQPGSIIINQARSLAIQQKWELLFMGVVTIIFHLSAVNFLPIPVAGLSRVPASFEGSAFLLFMDGALGSGLLWIYLLFGAFWAFRVWENLQIGDRTVFLSYPADRFHHQMYRIVAAASVLIAVLAFFWLFGATICELIFPGRSWFSYPPFNGSGWLVSLFGLINVYLYATMLALLFRRPELWFLVFIPVIIALVTWGIYLLDLSGLQDVLSHVMGWPFGVLSGFGFPVAETRPPWHLPELAVVLMWTIIFSASVYLAARRHRED